MNVLLDIGGTHTRIGLSEKGVLKSDPVIIDTPEDFEKGMEHVISSIKKLADTKAIHNVVVGIAGSLNKEKTELFRAPHLPQWEGKPIKRVLKDAFHVNVAIENDTALVGLGEAVFGAGKGKDIVVYITISTGVGGVRIVDGKIDRNALGFEPGHQTIVCSTHLNDDMSISQNESCKHRGHFESFVGGEALEMKYGKIPTEIKDPEVWDNVARYLACGLNNTLVYWSPDCIVLGGGLITHNAIDIKRVEKYLGDIVTIFPKLPPIVKAELGDIGGLHGGVAYLSLKN